MSSHRPGTRRRRGPVRRLRRWWRHRNIGRFETRLRYLWAQPVVRHRLFGGVGLIIGLGVIWLAITGYLARQAAHDLEKKLAELSADVSTGRIADARDVAKQIPAIARHAHDLTTGPAWWTAAQLPVVGEPFESVRGVTAAGAQVSAHDIPDLVDVAAALAPAKLRTAGNTVNLAPLQKYAPVLARAAASLRRAADAVNALPDPTWAGPVSTPRQVIAAQLTTVSHYVDAAARAARILPTMLGLHGPQRYFIGLQNEAEMRGTGGLPGTFAIVVADHGHVHFTHFGSDAELLPAATHQQIATGLDFGPGYDAAYGINDPTSFIVNSNMSPHFPYAARIWAAMWQKVSGQRVDGAIALDPGVLADFLAVTGPLAVPGGPAVSADSVVDLVQRDEYTIFADNFARKDYLVALLRAVSHALIDGRSDAFALAHAFSAAGNQHRVLVYSSSPAAESELAQTNFAGVIPAGGDRPFSGVVLNNTAAGKLDYYLTRSMTYQRSGCGRVRDVTVTVELTNNAPAAGLPPYVDTRLDAHGPDVQPGDNRTLLDYYATTGAQLLNATVDGLSVAMGQEHDRGRPIFRLDLELPRGTTRTVVINLREPAGAGSPLIWQQPGVSPLAVRVMPQHC